MASIRMNEGFRRVLDRNMAGTINLLSDTIKVMLLGTGYTPNKDHQVISDLGANELSGTGYTSGFGSASRKTLSSKVFTKDDTNDKVFFDAADVSWTAINAGTVGYAAIVKEGTADSDSPVIAIIDVSPDVATNGGDYTIQWPADGLFYV